MKEYRVYTIRLARYLTEHNFKIIRTVQDIKYPQYINWMFEFSKELEAAIIDYEREKNAEKMI